MSLLQRMSRASLASSSALGGATGSAAINIQRSYAASSADGSTSSAKTTRKTARKSPVKAVKAEKRVEQPRGEWTPDKRALLTERILVAGRKASDLTDLAKELQMSETQVSNALRTGANNLKAHLVDRARYYG